MGEIEYMTLPQASRVLGVSYQTLWRWLRNAQGPKGAHRTVGGHWRIPRASVDAYLEELKANGNAHQN